MPIVLMFCEILDFYGTQWPLCAVDAQSLVFYYFSVIFHCPPPVMNGLFLVTCVWFVIFVC